LPSGWTGRADVSAVPDKPLDPGFCADLVSDVLRRDPVRFESGKAELSAGIRKTLAGIADVMRRCGTARLSIVSTVETAAEAEPARELAEARATAITSALGELGIRKVARQASAAKVADPTRAGDQVIFEVLP
jgi:outer membrane protein OmpA-like peptidoglycan-associated protein